MKAIEAQLVPDPEKDQDADGEADRQAGDIEEGVEAIAADIAPGSQEVEADHCQLAILKVGIALPVVYSVLRLFTGLARVARRACRATVSSAMPNARIPATAKVHQPIWIR